ncbi:Protein of unknown function [Pyronema omphalodes CBS 100304]|uniref:Uncharacterized protein n=1 Tax=Pyronema omphalodes (strain CBS 100304) TaxID=1076935 RepID=U4L1Z5_PYROM|nr:Protein of unknown function [Pyronema omphalodes CBS 100304]
MRIWSCTCVLLRARSQISCSLRIGNLIEPKT